MTVNFKTSYEFLFARPFLRGAPPIVILPGFGNDSGDYLAPFGNVDASMAAALRARGWDVHVVELERKDWAKILRAVFSIGFWTGKSTTEPGYTWYLERVDDAVRRALAANEGETRVDFVAHSAGGWLGRAYIGGALNDVDRSGRRGNGSDGSDPAAGDSKTPVPHPTVRRFVSLGSPHVAPPPGANDATRGALKWVDQKWPGAYFSGDDEDGGVRYACVTGKEGFPSHYTCYTAHAHFFLGVSLDSNRPVFRRLVNVSIQV